MKFKVGDVCITQYTRYPLLNDGHWVEIVAISPALVDQNGEAAPYEIKRVDGEAHAYTANIPTGVRSWYKVCVVNCAEYKLRLAPPIDEAIEDVSDFTLLETRNLAGLAS